MVSLIYGMIYNTLSILTDLISAYLSQQNFPPKICIDILPQKTYYHPVCNWIIVPLILDRSVGHVTKIKEDLLEIG